jgi:hypothetical protein
MKRPLSVTVIAWLMILVCAGGFLSHLVFDFGLNPNSTRAFGSLTSMEIAGIACILILNVSGVGGGLGALRGRNWGRFLLTGWMALHVFISLRHSAQEVVVHAVFLLIIAWCLFRPAASVYFDHQAQATPGAPS